jgi:hypothetical protein
MPNNSHELEKLGENGLPTETGDYLVAISNTAMSEYCPKFQVAYFDKLHRSWRTEIYQPDEGTMEPTNLTADVTRWWHLPAA